MVCGTMLQPSVPNAQPLSKRALVHSRNSMYLSAVNHGVTLVLLHSCLAGSRLCQQGHLARPSVDVHAPCTCRQAMSGNQAERGASCQQSRHKEGDGCPATSGLRCLRWSVARAGALLTCIDPFPAADLGPSWASGHVTSHMALKATVTNHLRNRCVACLTQPWPMVRPRVRAGDTWECNLHS
jgi:hypothetical protein